jgi:hypothetical protein
MLGVREQISVSGCCVFVTMLLAWMRSGREASSSSENLIRACRNRRYLGVRKEHSWHSLNAQGYGVTSIIDSYCLYKFCKFILEIPLITHGVPRNSLHGPNDESLERAAGERAGGYRRVRLRHERRQALRVCILCLYLVFVSCVCIRAGGDRRVRLHQ